MEKTLEVKGMHCKSCKILIEDAVSEIKGVDGVSADFEKGKVKVKCSGDWVLSAAKSAIEKEGYKVVN